MKLILSPAKKMNIVQDILDYTALPEYLSQTEEILRWLKSKPYKELKELWKCNDKFA